MTDTDKVLAIFVEKLESLSAERKRIDAQMAALSLAYEALCGEQPSLGDDAPRTGKRMGKVDRAGHEKTLAFVAERKRPTKAGAVARHFGISRGAATQRLMKLTRAGKLVRTAKGAYAIGGES